MNHKHKGVYDSRGNERSHDVKRVHKDKTAMRWHIASLGKKKSSKLNIVQKTTKAKISPKRKTQLKKMAKPVIEAKAKASVISCPVKDGYISIDIDSLPVKGIKVTFTRREGRSHKTVGLQINKEPSGNNTLGTKIVDEQH